jgi:peptidoglycan/LPS O-acetylase OafA/YrhL
MATGTSHRFEALDGWRGIAALAIAFYHLPIAHPLREMSGWKNMELFVDLFFVLSGFVIMHAWGAKLVSAHDGRSFMIRRFWRVWPLHIVVLAGFVLAEVAEFFAARFLNLGFGEAPFSGPTSLTALFSNVVLMQALNLHGTTTWNGPAWSISVEFWTYALFALAMLFTRGRTFTLVLIAAAGFAVVAWLSPIFLFATHDFGMARAVYGFFTGAVVYRLVTANVERPVSGSAGELFVVAGMLAYLAATGLDASSLFAPLVFGALVLVFANGRGVVTGMLLSRPVQALGLWSYSIYLVHTLLYYGLRMGLLVVEKFTGRNFTASGSGSERLFSFGHVALDWAAILVLLTLTVWISRYTYELIEARYMAKATMPKARMESAMRLGQPAGQV